MTEPAPSCGPIALVMSRFPAVTETFILRELVELERQGVEVVLLPLLRDPVSVLHPEAEPWDRRALYSPFLSWPMLAANLRALARAPLRYLGTLLALLWDGRRSWNAWTGTLGIYPKCVWNAERIRARGVRHVHANYATHPAAAAYVLSRMHARGEPDLPYSLTVHAHDIFVRHADLRRRLRGARFVRAISAFNVSWLLRRYAGLDPRRFRVIHCGIEPERYVHRPAAGRPVRERPARLLAIASFRPYKGLPFLIDALALLRDRGVDVVAEVIGEGEMRDELERRIGAAGLGERVSLVGTRTQAEVAEALAGADLFVLPSVVAGDGQMEGIPVCLMEALAAGLPTVATRISGIPELVRDGETGALVEPASARELAAAIERTLLDYDGALARARRGRELVRKEFEIRENVRRLIREIADTTPQPNLGIPAITA
jgi:glycosyltransferase involved in cell wall biosynthesis